MRGIVAAKIDKQAYYLLSNSDGPGDQLVTHLLKGTNYPIWRKAITNTLVSKHKIMFVHGRLSKPAKGDPEEENWITCNSMVISWILNSLNEELHNNIVYHDITRSMWLELEDRFSQGSDPKIQEIKREILSAFAKPHDPMCLDCACGVAAKDEEEERLHQFVMGLNEAFGLVRSNILCKEPLTSLSNACALLTLEEIHHTKENCFEIVGYLPNWQGKKTDRHTTHTITVDTTHTGTRTQQPLSHTRAVNQLLALLAKENQIASNVNFIGNIKTLPWLSDSGASDHIVSDVTLLKATYVLTKPTKVTLPNGKKVETTIVGDDSFPFRDGNTGNQNNPSEKHIMPRSSDDDELVMNDVNEELESSQDREDDNDQLVHAEDLKPVTRPTRAHQALRHLEDYAPIPNHDQSRSSLHSSPPQPVPSKPEQDPHGNGKTCDLMLYAADNFVKLA
ncbi:Retrotransposon Copia-like, N-terminal [Dillenia turbinata]|uniref:Retrotransposon Copia-like, N-terminal n=1 Tax=Dillenia turbinata TaxID=194707 RepID=A0AAN8UI49_9MAGN